jgi:pimeloyl-ACP methyl ester carboxylesterase
VAFRGARSKRSVMVLTGFLGWMGCVSWTMAVADPASSRGEDSPPAVVVPALSRVEDFAPPSEFLTVQGIKTHHITRGERGRPVVLVHGFGSSTFTWRRNLDALGARYRVHALDLKGFGLTEKPRDGQYHLAAYSKHLLAYLDAMDLERPVLVGNSMGGAVVARLALTHPHRVSGLVLVDPAPLRFPPEGLAPSSTTRGPQRTVRPDREGENHQIEKPKSPESTRLASRGGTGLPGGRFVPALARALITRDRVDGWLRSAYHDPGMVTDEMVDVYFRPLWIEGAAEALSAMMNPPPSAAEKLPPLDELRVPTLVLWGSHDRFVPREVAEFYARSIPDSRLLIFENSGHLPHEEEPERFHEELIRFVDRLPESARPQTLAP